MSASYLCYWPELVSIGDFGIDRDKTCFGSNEIDAPQGECKSPPKDTIASQVLSYLTIKTLGDGI